MAAQIAKIMKCSCCCCWLLLALLLLIEAHNQRGDAIERIKLLTENVCFICAMIALQARQGAGESEREKEAGNIRWVRRWLSNICRQLVARQCKNNCGLNQLATFYPLPHSRTHSHCSLPPSLSFSLSLVHFIAIRHAFVCATFLGTLATFSYL